MKRPNPALIPVLGGVALLVTIAVAAWKRTDDLPLPGINAFLAIAGGLFVIGCLIALFVWLQFRGRRRDGAADGTGGNDP